MNYKITWQKPNGITIDRYIRNNPNYELGYINSYNWKVVDIRRNKNNQWLSLNDYNMQSFRSIRKHKIENNIRHFIKDYELFIIIVVIYIMLKCL